MDVSRFVAAPGWLAGTEGWSAQLDGWFAEVGGRIAGVAGRLAAVAGVAVVGPALLLLLRTRTTAAARSRRAHEAAGNRDPPVEIGATYEFGVREITDPHSGARAAVGKVEGFVLFAEDVSDGVGEGDVVRDGAVVQPGADLRGRDGRGNSVRAAAAVSSVSDTLERSGETFRETWTSPRRGADRRAPRGNPSGRATRMPDASLI